MKKKKVQLKKLFQFDIEKSWDYENGFYITSHQKRLSKALAHYELYKSIVGLPGQVVECGVYKGASLIRFATFRDILENTYSRKIIGFDAFGKFPNVKNKRDKRFIDQFEGAGGRGISVGEMQRVFTHKGFGNHELIAGDILKTLPAYLKEHPELKIALLHVDVDVYKPTKFILQKLYDHIVKNGLIIFDDFSTVHGETKAIDEFLADKKLVIEKLPIAHIPAFIRKR